MPRARTLVLVVRYCGFVCPFDAFFCKIVHGQFLVIFVYTCKTRVYLLIKVASRQGNFLYQMNTIDTIYECYIIRLVFLIHQSLVSLFPLIH